MVARELRRGTLLEAFETHEDERLLDRGRDLLLARPRLGDLERIRDVLEDVHVRPDGVALEDHADPARLRRDERAVPPDDPPPDRDAPPLGALEAGAAAKGPRLNASRGPEAR